MAIDPPYRLDPFRNIINIHWGGEEQTTGEQEYQYYFTFGLTIFGSHWSAGYYNNNIYDMYCGYGALETDGWTISLSSYQNIGNYNLTNPQNFATAWASSAASGLFFGATWESHANGTNETLESWGPYGVDLTNVTATENSNPSLVFRAVELINVMPAYWQGDDALSGCLVGDLVLGANDE